MANGDLLTVGDIAEIFAVEAWRVRRTVDSIDCGLRRVGLYRLIPRAHLATVGAELQRRGWLPASANAEPDGVPNA